LLHVDMGVMKAVRLRLTSLRNWIDRIKCPLFFSSA